MRFDHYCRMVLPLAAAVLLAMSYNATPCRAQAFDNVALFQETINSDFFGVDARAMGMGNTGIVSARDGSGLIYNPANLARVRRIEFRGGLSHLRLDNSTELIDQSEGRLLDGRDLKKTHINALSLTLPVPTYRGSLVFAFGVHRVNNFDRAFGVTIPEPDFPEISTSNGREIESGGLWKWSGGAAVDISPKLSVGLSLHVLSGKDNYGWTRTYPSSTLNMLLDQSIDIDYLGAGATAGLTYAASSAITVGAIIETPTYLEAEERFFEMTRIDSAVSAFIWETETSDYAEYSVTKPFTFGLGASGSFDRLLLVGDLRYTDWSQLGFGYQDNIVPDNREDQFINDNLKEVLSLHLGTEYLFPDQGVSLRAGYLYDPLPIASTFVASERQYFTLGAGFLLDRVMTIDIAYVDGGYKLRDAYPGSYFADYKIKRVFVTFAYRI